MTFAEAMQFQGAFCEANGAPITAGVCRALAGALDNGSATGRRAIGWPGEMFVDALPLRLVAPFHALHRSGRAQMLAALFEGRDEDGCEAIRQAVRAHDAEIVGWLDGPPQTNATGRSASFMAALSVLAQRFDHAFELIEIGSSAGLNLLIDRYRYVLGGVGIGPADSPVVIEPEWTGAPPPTADVRIASVTGCDIAPLDVRDAAAAERLLSYVWVDQRERLHTTAAAIAMVQAAYPDLVAADAADFVEARFATPQAAGTTRVLMHSIVWQYLPPATQAHITAAIERAGAAATPDRSLAWIAFEADRGIGWPALTLRCWPAGGTAVELATGHPHGTAVTWCA